MWGAIAGIGASLLGGLLGGGGPKIDETNYNEAMQWLTEQYKNAQNPYYEGVMRQMMDYFAQGGTATDANRQKAYSQVLAPINQMIPDARTRIQNSMARAGIMTPGTVQNKFETDAATKAAFSRGQAIEGVNQRFDERLDQNKALALSSSQQFASLLRNLSMQAAGQKGQLALGQQSQQLQRSTMGTNWGQMLMGLGGSLIGGWANGTGGWGLQPVQGNWDIGNQWGGNLMGTPSIPGFTDYQSPYVPGLGPQPL